MYGVSSEFLESIVQPSRTIKIKAVIGTTEVTDETVVDFSVESSLGNDGLPSLGAVTSSKLNISFINSPTLPELKGNPIQVFAAILVGEEYSWLPLGTFYAEKIKKTDLTISAECFDKLFALEKREYETNLTFPSNLQTVVNDISSRYGLGVKDVSKLPNPVVKEKPKGGVRGMLAELAELASCNVFLNRENKLEFKFYKEVAFKVTPDNYIDFKQTSEKPLSITKLIVEKNGVVTVGGVEEEIPDVEYGGTGGTILRFENDSINSPAELKTVFDRSFPFTYIPYDCKCQGMPHLDVGDIISITDMKGVTVKVPLISHTLTFNGGLSSEFNANAPASEGISSGSTGGSYLSSYMEYIVRDNDRIFSSITQQADKIALKVNKDEFGSLIEQNAKSVKYHFTNGTFTSAVTEINKDGLLVKNPELGSTSVNTFGAESRDMFGNKTLSMRGGGLSFYGVVGFSSFIRASFLPTYSKSGVGLVSAPRGDYVDIGYSNNADDTGNFDYIMHMRFNKPHGYYLFDSPHPIIEVDSQLSETGLKFVNKNFPSYNGAIWHSMADNKLYVGGDNGTALMYRVGDTWNNALIVDESQAQKVQNWENWNFHNYTMYNMKTANIYANTRTRKVIETKGIDAEEAQVRYLFKDLELVDGKVTRSLPLKYQGAVSSYDIASIVCKGKGSAWVSKEEDNYFTIEGDCEKVNVEIILYLIEEDVIRVRTEMKPQIEEPSKEPIVVDASPREFDIEKEIK